MTDCLVSGDKQYWWPIPTLIGWLSYMIPTGAKVLDVGPDEVPFHRATVLADMAPCETRKPDQEFVKCEVGPERLPFPDKHFDFVYCRHALEDMADPFATMREIERVGKAGYIETPSPLAELCRCVDGGAPLWRGYNHHRWIVWAHDGELRFVTKFSLIEHMDGGELDLAEALRQGPLYWNTYHLWRDKIRFAHRTYPADFAMPAGYPAQLTNAVQESVVAPDAFWARLPIAIPEAYVDYPVEPKKSHRQDERAA